MLFYQRKPLDSYSKMRFNKNMEERGLILQNIGLLKFRNDSQDFNRNLG